MIIFQKQYKLNNCAFNFITVYQGPIFYMKFKIKKITIQIILQDEKHISCEPERDAIIQNFSRSPQTTF